MFYKKRYFYKFRKIQRKALVTESFFNKETLVQVFSFEFSEIFKNTFFTELLRATTSKLWDMHCLKNNFGVRGSSYLYWLDHGDSKEKEKQL